MLKVKEIVKVFGQGTVNEKLALKKVNLHLLPGDFVTVIGGNGAGKSTLLNSIAGVYTVDQGTLEIDGVNVTRLSEHKRAKFLGRVFQDPMMGTAADMSIEENLALASRRGQRRGLKWYITNKERKEYSEILRELDLGLESRLMDKVGLLSGGQRQALTLIMATMRSPKILLLDEHTAALDPKTAAKVLDVTKRLIDENHLTTMMVTHNMNDAIHYGNRLIMMNEGQIIYEVSGEEKAKLHKQDLISLFATRTGDGLVSDRVLLS